MIYINIVETGYAGVYISRKNLSGSQFVVTIYYFYQGFNQCKTGLNMI